MELVDIYNEKREMIGVKERHSLEDGEYLIGVRAIIINRDNQILITKRSEIKKLEPLKWECSGGVKDAGESSKCAIKRELNEELGIKIKDENLKFYKTIKREKEFTDIFIVYINLEVESLKFKDNEVCDAKFVSLDEFENMKANKDLVSNEIITKEMIEEIIKNR